MNKKFILLMLLFPSISFAALDGVKSLLSAFSNILNDLVPVIFGLALIYFFWGIAQFILHDAGDSKTREDGKKKILWGIIALFVFVSIYGILNWIGVTFDIITPGQDIHNINPYNINIRG